MIARLWRGWTSRENAEAYEGLLISQIFPAIRKRGIDGFQSIELMRRQSGDEVEFVTLMVFASMEAVRAFAGDEYEIAVVPEGARALLSRFDERAAHYEVRVPRPSSAHLKLER